MKNWILSAMLASLVIAGCGSGSGDASSAPAGDTSSAATTPAPSGDKVAVAFVTNNTSDFWKIAQAGCEKAEKELGNVKLEFKMPADGTAAAQKQILDDLVANGIKAIAVSPVDPKGQSADLDGLAGKTFLMTQDSDAPNSKREVFLGTDNVAAGRMAGEEVKKALPGGGKIAVFVGKADAQNAKERFQGLQEALKGSNITIIGDAPKTDDTDRARAKQNVADTLVANADVACLVGLWSYNGPAILNAVKEAKKEGKVKIVALDDETDTLKGVEEGFIEATIVQQPFEFGYQSVKLMAAAAAGDKKGIPTNKQIFVPTTSVKKDSVVEFAKKLKEMTGK